MSCALGTPTHVSGLLLEKEAGIKFNLIQSGGGAARLEQLMGKHIHVSAGVTIGGVLEPVQANPVIIEDGVFIGSRCSLVEGIHVQRNAVIGANVTLTASTRIIDVTQQDNPQEYRGHVPEDAVVIPGTWPKRFPAGLYHVPCALIIGKRTTQTDRKTSLNAVLRDYAVCV